MKMKTVFSSICLGLLFFCYAISVDAAVVMRQTATSTVNKTNTHIPASLVLSIPTTLSVTNGLVLWTRADLGVTKDGGDAVSVWADQSGHNNNFTECCQQPMWVANGINGKPVIRMSADSGQTMSISANFPAPTTVIYVGKMNGGTNGRLLNGLSNNWVLGFWQGKRQQAYFEGWVYSPEVAPGSDPYIYTATIPGSGNNSTIYENGVSLASNPLGVTGPSGLCLNGWNCGSEFSDGDIAEVLVYNRVLSSTELAQVDTYLSQRYNITTSDVASFDPLIMHYSFDGSTISGNTIRDISATNNSATRYPVILTGDGWTVSDAGSSEWNGDYVEYGTVSGQPAYKKDDTHFLYYSNAFDPIWILSSDTSDLYGSNWAYYQYNFCSDPTCIDDGGWYQSNAANPAPNFATFTAGVATSTPWQAVGKIGQALKFDGSTQYVRAFATVLPTETGSRSVCAWVNPDSTSGGYHDIFAYGDATTDEAFKLERNGDDLVGSGWSDDITATNFLTQGIWTYVCLTYDGTTAKLYGNGSLLTSGAVSWDTTASNYMYIGASLGGASEFWDGKIDDLRIYNAALTAAEIASFYTKQSGNKVIVSSNQNSKNTSGLVGLWSFNGKDLSGTTAYDRSGQGNNGTLTNGPRVAIGKVGQAVNFDGGDDYVSVPTALNFSSLTDWTISEWIKPTTNPGVAVMGLHWIPATSGNNIYLLVGVGNDMRVATYLPGETLLLPDAVNAITVGVWQHFTLTKSGTTYTLYKNGSVISTGTASVSYSAPFSGKDFYAIGNESGTLSQGFNGSIDEFRIYNRALSTTEVLQLYNLGK